MTGTPESFINFLIILTGKVKYLYLFENMFWWYFSIRIYLFISYWYVTELTADAKFLSSYARKRTIDTEDVRLSACQIQERQVSCPPRHVVSQVKIIDINWVFFLTYIKTKNIHRLHETKIVPIFQLQSTNMDQDCLPTDSV